MVFSFGVTLEHIYLNWLNWFYSLIFVVSPHVTIIDCMIFFSCLYLDVIRMSISTVSCLARLDSAIIFLENAVLWPMIQMTLNLELIATRHLRVLSNQFFLKALHLFIFCLETSLLAAHAEPYKEWIPLKNAIFSVI